jgi:hypothetical protein
VFASYLSGVNRVSFWLDDPTPHHPVGPAMHTERHAPFDLVGSAANGTALPLRTTNLRAGVHTLTARLTLLDGTAKTIGPVRFETE